MLEEGVGRQRPGVIKELGPEVSGVLWKGFTHIAYVTNRFLINMGKD